MKRAKQTNSNKDAGTSDLVAKIQELCALRPLGHRQNHTRIVVPDRWRLAMAALRQLPT